MRGVDGGGLRAAASLPGAARLVTGAVARSGPQAEAAVPPADSVVYVSSDRISAVGAASSGARQPWRWRGGELGRELLALDGTLQRAAAGGGSGEGGQRVRISEGIPQITELGV